MVELFILFGVTVDVNRFAVNHELIFLVSVMADMSGSKLLVYS